MSDDLATEATTEAAEEAQADDDLGLDGDFDPDRALRTIRQQREAERRLKAELQELKEKAEAYDAEQAAKADAEKSLTDKLTEREATIASLKAELAERDVRADFRAKALDRGIDDLDLAWLAAKEQGLLGRLDPKTGVVGDHDFEKLAELYPSLSGDLDDDLRPSIMGDAGRRGRPKKVTPNEAFNRTVREALRR